MWHRIRLRGPLLDAAVEQLRILNILGQVLLERNMAVAMRVGGLRAAGHPVTMTDREVQVYSHRERDDIVLHANDVALEALHRAGEVPPVESVVSELPEARLLALLIQNRLFTLQD
jgi:hypothetical protein